MIRTVLLGKARLLHIGRASGGGEKKEMRIGGDRLRSHPLAAFEKFCRWKIDVEGPPTTNLGRLPTCLLEIENTDSWGRKNFVSFA